MEKISKKKSKKIEDYGSAIKAMRKKRNLTQKKLAEMLGISPQNISHYESGEKKMSVLKFKSIAAAMNFEVLQFIREI